MDPRNLGANEKCPAVAAVENGIEIARGLGIKDTEATLFIVLGHLRSRFPDVAAAVLRIAEGK